MTENWNQHMKKRTNEMLMFSMLLVLTTTDISLTLYALSIGFVEANPIMAFLMNISVPFTIGIKYAIIIIPAVVTMVILNKKERGSVMNSLWIAVIGSGVVVAWNIIMLLSW